LARKMLRWGHQAKWQFFRRVPGVSMLKLWEVGHDHHYHT
jgi:hypothetical protein